MYSLSHQEESVLLKLSQGHGCSRDDGLHEDGRAGQVLFTLTARCFAAHFNLSVILLFHLNIKMDLHMTSGVDRIYQSITAHLTCRFSCCYFTLGSFSLAGMIVFLAVKQSSTVAQTRFENGHLSLLQLLLLKYMNIIQPIHLSFLVLSVTWSCCCLRNFPG